MSTVIKICKKCGLEKIKSSCINCKKIYDLNRYANNKEEILLKVKKYRENNLINKKLYEKKYREKNKEIIKIKKKREYRKITRRVLSNRYMNKYGITLDEKEQLLKDQGSVCQICKSSDPKSKRGFVVDHDHATGKVRSILCQYCNVGLGNFRDNIELLYKAIDYLRFHENKNFAEDKGIEPS